MKIILHISSEWYQKNKLFALIIILYILFSQPAFSQVDSVDTDSSKHAGWFDASDARVEYFTLAAIEAFTKIDTSLNHFQTYNPARKNLFQSAYLGNLGSPAYSRFFTFNPTLNFDYGRHAFDLYTYAMDSIKYFRTNYPFTDLYYVLGSNSEQLFHIKHSRNIGPRANFTLDFERLNAVGYYQNQQNSYNNFSFSSWYKTKDLKYSIYGAFIYGGIENEESGGIVSDSVFYLAQQNFATTFRDNAFTKWKNFQGQLTQVYSIGKKEMYAENDTQTQQYFVPLLQLKYTFGASDYHYTFEDDATDRSYYDTIYTDADTLRDIVDVAGFYNRLSISNSKLLTIQKDSFAYAKLNWELYGLQQYTHVNDEDSDYIYTHYITGASLGNMHAVGELLHFYTSVNYDIKNKTYSMFGKLLSEKYAAKPTCILRAGKYEPTAIQTHYSGFALRYNNQLNDVQYLSAELTATVPYINTTLTYAYHAIRNYIYFTDSAQVMQADKSDLQIIHQLTAEKKFTIGNFHFNNAIGLQFFNADAVKLPAFIATASWYYQKYLFNSALFMQTGIDAWYCSNYYGYAYNSITGQFGVQSSDYKLLSFYPVIDAFINFDIKSFRFFLKAENISQDVFSKGYFEAPNYPMQDRSFKLGVNWYLFY